MHSTQDVTLVPEAVPEVRREEIHEQLERLLASHHFKNSRRYPALLRFIVEESLEGRGAFLKERLLGIQVFDRPSDYDTAADPIVRVTIAEIRKRIAQYYHEEEHSEELRIDLQPGHYAPEFRPGRRGGRSSTGEKSAAIALEVHEGGRPTLVEPLPIAPRPEGSGSWPRMLWLLLGALIVCAAGAAAIPAWQWMHPTAADELWGPMLSSRRPVLFCIPTIAGLQRYPRERDDLPLGTQPANGAGQKQLNSATPTFRDFENMGQNVVFSDVLATLRMANMLAAHRREYRVKLNVATSLDDLRQGPTILIGALDNGWTLRALTNLPYTFSGDGNDRYWIVDGKNPAYRGWSLDLKQTLGSVTSDYAIVARLHNQQTAEPQIIVAGIGMSGTAAAGEFLVTEAELAELRRKIGPGFKDRDFEVVLRTDVVNGIAGAPRILAVALL